MMAQSLSYFVLGAMVAGDAGRNRSWSLEGVDPNSLSCDPNGLEFLLLPHFEECNKFYMCVNGEEVEFYCAATMIFDFVYQGCNWESVTECVLREREEIEGSGEHTEASVEAAEEEKSNLEEEPNKAHDAPK